MFKFNLILDTSHQKKRNKRNKRNKSEERKKKIFYAEATYQYQSGEREAKEKNDKQIQTYIRICTNPFFFLRKPNNKQKKPPKVNIYIIRTHTQTQTNVMTSSTQM